MSPVDTSSPRLPSLLLQSPNFTLDRQPPSRSPSISPSLRDRKSSPLARDNARRMDDQAGHGKKPVWEGFEDWSILNSISAVCKQDTSPNAVADERDLEDSESFSSCYTRPAPDLDQLGPGSAKPFQRWMRTLQKRSARRQERSGRDGTFAPYFLGNDGNALAAGSAHHRNSSSESSFGFVTAVKSASISLAGVSLLTRSRRDTIRSSHAHSRTDHSSRASISGARLSEDSFCRDRQIFVDPAVTERALQRRQILEELISTEESYIGDVRFLMNVYVTLLASLPTSPACLRSSVNQNLADIVELHEEILGDLYRVVPNSEYPQTDMTLQRTQSNPPVCGHHRWRSLDAVPEGKRGTSRSRDAARLSAEPQTAADVAKVFLKRMNRFFSYEEYGAKYELMIKDIAAVHRTMPGWPSYQKGLEVLAASMGSAKSHQCEARKSLTIADLLVKPIQRVCRYPLLFSELLKYTPVVDCPYSHMEIENTLIRLREATGEINRATDDPRIKSTLEKTWILQDRLTFPNQQLDAASKSRIRSFGHIQLCGALHVCWQTRDGVNGQYMVALMYREWLCLATAGRIDQVYTIQACIALSNIKVEEVDNGRGLQCHTARHSWKIVFLSDHQLYELILTACSPKEEIEWRARLVNRPRTANAGDQDQLQSETFSFLSLNVRALGTVFRKPGTLARRLSIHRATTVGPKSTLCQVILKNTSAIKETSTFGNGSQINRSQSLLTTNNRIPVLAPSRGERARLETLLSDVWTRDVLPFPGITTRSRSEQLVRASASSMMRKLSVVSITSSFTRRSSSLASLQQKEKGGADEEASRTSEGTYRMAHGQHGQDRCASPVLSAITDRAEPFYSPFLQGDDWGSHLEIDFGTVRRRINTVDGSSEPADPRVTDGISRSSTTSAVPLSRGKSSGERGFLRVSGQPTDLGEGTVSALRESPPPRPQSQPPGDLASGKGSSRSNRFSGKFAKARVRHRDAVAQGIRSLFR